MKKVRLDQLVFDLGLSESRERAKAIIMSGVVYVNGIRSLHEFFSEDCFFEVQSEEQKGTTFLIEMPKQKGAGYYAENSDH